VEQEVSCQGLTGVCETLETPGMFLFLLVLKKMDICITGKKDFLLKAAQETHVIKYEGEKNGWMDHLRIPTVTA